MQDAETPSDQGQSLQTAGKSQEEIVFFLRAQGCSKVESIVVKAKTLGIGLGKAKKVAHFSSAWADTHERDEKFHASFEESAAKWGATDGRN